MSGNMPPPQHFNVLKQDLVKSFQAGGLDGIDRFIASLPTYKLPNGAELRPSFLYINGDNSPRNLSDLQNARMISIGYSTPTGDARIQVNSNDTTYTSAWSNGQGVVGPSLRLAPTVTAAATPSAAVLTRTAVSSEVLAITHLFFEAMTTTPALKRTLNLSSLENGQNQFAGLDVPALPGVTAEPGSAARAVPASGGASQVRGG